ncbi:MAG: hypothetical protein ACP5E9_02725 [Candidatus Methanospirareceae archaeon]
MNKKVVAFIQQCTPLAELHVEVVGLHAEDRAVILEELEGFTIITDDAKTLQACKSAKFDLLKEELDELLKKGWEWSD